MSLYSKAEVWQASSKLTQSVSRGRLIRGFRLRIQKCVERGDQLAKAGDLTQAAMQWAEAGAHWATLLEVFGPTAKKRVIRHK